MTRTEMYDYIKQNGLNESVCKCYGVNNYTRLSNVALETFIEGYKKHQKCTRKSCACKKTSKPADIPAAIIDYQARKVIKAICSVLNMKDICKDF